MMTMILAMCVGGPMHGTYHPLTKSPLCFARPEPATVWYGPERDPYLAIPPASDLYYPTEFMGSAWRVRFPIFAHESIAGTGVIPAGLQLPGGTQDAHYASVDVCRWCFAFPRTEDLETCYRRECVHHWASVQWLDTVTDHTIRRWDK